MSHAVRLDQRVLADLSRAMTWYDAKEDGLGARFRAAFYASIDGSARHPSACAPYRSFASHNVRHSLVRDFPYAFYFVDHPKETFVVLLFHSARDPRSLERMIARRAG